MESGYLQGERDDDREELGDDDEVYVESREPHDEEETESTEFRRRWSGLRRSGEVLNGR